MTQVRNPRPRVALYGNFGCGNLGNECTLAAAHVGLAGQMPDAEFFAIGADPAELSRLHGIEAAAIDQFGRAVRDETGGAADWLLVRLTKRLFNELREFRRARRALRGSNALLVVGTGILEDDTGALGWFISLLRWVVVARVSRCKVAFVSIGAGPVRPGLPSRLVRLQLRLAHYVSYRDEHGRDWMSRIGVNVNDHAVMPDLAFALNRPALPSGTPHDSAGRSVALGVMEIESLSHARITGTTQRRYVARLVELVSAIVQSGERVEIVYGDKAHDLSLAEELLDRCRRRLGDLPAERLAFRRAETYQALLDVLVDQDLVIASRFHNLILGLLLGKPVIAMAYHEQHRDLMTQFGLDEFVHDLLDFDPKQLTGQAMELLSASPALEQRIADRVEEYRRRLNAQFELLASLCRHS